MDGCAHIAMAAASVSVSLVKLPPPWQSISSGLWAIDTALGGRGGFRDVARRTHAYTTDGERHEVTCLAQHGLERRVLYALFLEELRARGWLDTLGSVDAKARDGGARPSPPTKKLYLIPAVPVPPSVNQSTRMLLSLGLQEAVLRSVRAHPVPPGSTGPNHFIIVARVCSCFISGDRRPALGKRARDECQPFPRIGPTRGELNQAVRVLSWEQVTPLDRRWSTSSAVPPRLPNLVVPYPSSLLGADAQKKRMAPWELPNLRKSVRVFAAFGMLSNLTRATPEELRAGFRTHCSASERTMISQSSCYGKHCRFALRALVMQQLEVSAVAVQRWLLPTPCTRALRPAPDLSTAY